MSQQPSKFAMPMKTLVLATVLGSLLSGCALLKQGEAPRDTFELTAPQNFSGLKKGSRAQLLVKQPTALKSVDSNRMVVRNGPTEITYLAGAQWSDTVPRMVQAKLVAAFENTGRTGATAKPGDGLVIDYQLIIDIRRFEIANGASSEVQVEMSVKLLSDKSGKVIETGIFDTAATVTGDDVTSQVAAFDRAFDKVARDIISWVSSRV